MKKLTLTLFLALICRVGFAQNRQVIDSLKHELAIVKHDTSRVLVWVELCNMYRNLNPDSAQIYGQQALDLTQKIKFSRGEALASEKLGTSYRSKGDYPNALKFLFRGLQIAQDNKYLNEVGHCLNSIAIVYSQLEDNPIAIKYQKRAVKAFESAQDLDQMVNSEINLGRSYRRNNQLDSATIYLQKGYDKLECFKYSASHSWLFMEMGSLQFQLGNQNKAFEYLRESMELNKKHKDHFYGTFAYNVVAEFFKKMNQADSCIYYAKKAFTEAQLINYKYGILGASTLLTEQFEAKDLKEAHYYLKLAKALNDELYGSKKVQELQKIISEEQERQRQAEVERKIYQNKLKLYTSLAVLSLFSLISFILYRNNRQKQKANALLQDKNEEIQTTLEKLKSTQTQLIQSEKLASLGELTAGIAHEIQNPLNFVNNFSEVSAELVEEMQEELDKGDTQEAKAIADDIKQNLQKINLHGQRASSIVKGMLEHSRASTGQREPTNLNALADEYLKLAYHGLRAKDNRFNVELKTEFAQNLPPVEGIAQDLGRVLLNLFNNGFYATQQRVKQNQPGYQPTVTVSTRFLESDPLSSPERATSIAQLNGLGRQMVEIRVRDNGIGMPESVREKIFQPFFTTKPTGEGTGLGLSLAYDIVTKGHSGTIECESIEGEGTTFVVKLPIS